MEIIALQLPLLANHSVPTDMMQRLTACTHASPDSHQRSLDVDPYSYNQWKLPTHSETGARVAGKNKYEKVRRAHALTKGLQSARILFRVKSCRGCRTAFCPLTVVVEHIDQNILALFVFQRNKMELYLLCVSFPSLFIPALIDSSRMGKH